MINYHCTLVGVILAIGASYGESLSGSRFHCLYPDGVSGLYIEKTSGRSVIFKCMMETKCYQVANKDAEIQCSPGGSSSSSSPNGDQQSNSGQQRNSDQQRNNESTEYDSLEVIGFRDPRAASSQDVTQELMTLGPVNKGMQLATSSAPRQIMIDVVLPTFTLSIDKEATSSRVFINSLRADSSRSEGRTTTLTLENDDLRFNGPISAAKLEPSAAEMTDEPSSSAPEAESQSAQITESATQGMRYSAPNLFGVTTQPANMAFSTMLNTSRHSPVAAASDLSAAFSSAEQATIQGTSDAAPQFVAPQPDAVRDLTQLESSTEPLPFSWSHSVPTSLSDPAALSSAVRESMVAALHSLPPQLADPTPKTVSSPPASFPLNFVPPSSPPPPLPPSLPPAPTRLGQPNLFATQSNWIEPGTRVKVDYPTTLVVPQSQPLVISIYSAPDNRERSMQTKTTTVVRTVQVLPQYPLHAPWTVTVGRTLTPTAANRVVATPTHSIPASKIVSILIEVLNPTVSAHRRLTPTPESTTKAGENDESSDDSDDDTLESDADSSDASTDSDDDDDTKTKGTKATGGTKSRTKKKASVRVPSETHSAETESRSAETESRSAETESRSAETESHSFSPESHSIKTESHSFPPESHSAESESHSAESNPHSSSEASSTSDLHSSSEAPSSSDKHLSSETSSSRDKRSFGEPTRHHSSDNKHLSSEPSRQHSSRDKHSSSEPRTHALLTTPYEDDEITQLSSSSSRYDDIDVTPLPVHRHTIMNGWIPRPRSSDDESFESRHTSVKTNIVRSTVTRTIVNATSD